MKKQVLDILGQLPFFKKVIYNFKISKRFKNEIELLNHQGNTSSNQPSILHFSLNKAATQHVKKLLSKIACHNHLIPIFLHDFAFHSDLPYFDSLSFEEMKKYNHVFKEKGYLYSVFGGVIENIENFNQYMVILSIRDPRDILVSLYFSTSYSHSTPSEFGNKQDDFLKKRDIAKRQNIDDFVLNEADNLLEVFEKYQEFLVDKYNIGIVKYEDMVSNYEEWLMDLSFKAGLNLSETLKNDIISENSKRKKSAEDIFQHNRKGVAGDYKEKLLPETIEKLNIKFSKVLKFYEY